MKNESKVFYPFRPKMNLKTQNLRDKVKARIILMDEQDRESDNVISKLIKTHGRLQNKVSTKRN